MPEVDSGITPGWGGTTRMARYIGKRRTKEINIIGALMSAERAVDWGLWNRVVPTDQLDAEVAQWCSELVERSPTAIAIAKRSFNADSENIRGIAGLGFTGLSLYYATDESKEGGAAQKQKRTPEFRKFT